MAVEKGQRRGPSRRGGAATMLPGQQAIDAFQTGIGYRFAKSAMLLEALTHASADTGGVGRGRRGLRVNERLEFLGDRVLGLMAAQALLSAFPDAPEGELAPRLNALVRKETCAEIAIQAGLDAVLVLAEAEDSAGGRQKTAILGDACEALIAAIYLDGGFDAARVFFDRFWSERVTAQDTVPRDPKTRLQEWAQARWRVTPTYEVQGRSGPDHAPEFVVTVDIPGVAPGEGRGPSKRAAEQDAAAHVIEREKIGPEADGS